MVDLDRDVLDAATTSLFAAAEAGDWDAFAAHFAPTAELHQNVWGTQSLSEALVGLPAVTADGTTLRYENVRRLIGPSHVTEIHDAVFTKPDGRIVRLDICVVIQFDADAKIVRSDEFLDSGAAAALAG